MPLYKPSRETALDLLLQHMSCPLPEEDISVAVAQRRVVAGSVLAPLGFPRENLSMRDGFAIDRLRDPSQRLYLRTGEVVPDWAVAVVPVEEYDPAGPFESFAQGVDSRRPSIVRAGSEYEAGDIVVQDGAVLDHRHIAQLAWFGIESIRVRRRPRIRFAMLDTAPACCAVTSFLRGFATAFCDVEGETSFLSQASHLRDLQSEDDLLLLISDEQPGRYAELKALFSEPKAGFEPLAWKLDLHPCKHLGIARFGHTPTLVMPDVFFKTVLTAYAFLPDVLAAMTGLKTHKRLVTFVEPPTIAYPYPCLVPLRIEEERRDLKVRATQLRSSFSGRHVGAAEGYVILNAPLADGVPCEAVLLDRLVPQPTLFPKALDDEQDEQVLTEGEPTLSGFRSG
ncbi:MAG: hypothetical protein MUC50_04410 [Myxococcota bacterium]|nr:hypothetical protein [Myxococcota bacterium]